MKILPIITVRKGSSLKDKNIRLYKGKPLLVNAIDKLKKSLGYCLVISDNKEYGELASKNGVDVFYDKTVGKLDDVTLRFKNYCKETNYDGWIILYQCTSPNIKEETIKKFYEEVQKLDEDEVLMSCVIFDKKASALYLLNKNGYLNTAIQGMPIVSKPRQILQDVYYYNGGLTAFHSKQSYKESLFEGANLKPFMITEEEILDIDKEKDFMITENELPTWQVANIVSANDNVVKFAFECNEATTHDNEKEIETTINSI